MDLVNHLLDDGLLGIAVTSTTAATSPIGSSRRFTKLPKGHVPAPSVHSLSPTQQDIGFLDFDDYLWKHIVSQEQRRHGLRFPYE
jgi:hypothetical protein